MLGLILLSLKLFMFAKFCKAGGTGPLWVPVPTQPFHSRVYLHQVSHVCDDLFKQVQLFALPLNIFRLCSTALAPGPWVLAVRYPQPMFYQVPKSPVKERAQTLCVYLCQ